MKLNFNFIKDLSLIRLSGINKFICIDIHSGYIKFLCLKRKARFYQIKKKTVFDEVEVIATEYKKNNGIIDSIQNDIKDIINKYNFYDAALLIGLNDFKYSTVSVPIDIEDSDLWFLENSSKFLPEGRPADEFSYSYEKFKEDENSRYYFIVVARNDFIKQIIKSCKIEGIKLLGIFPFPLSLFFLDNRQNKNILYLGFEEDKIIYSFFSESGNFIYRDMFFDIYESVTGSNIPLELKDVNPDSLNFCLEELKQTISLSFGDQAFDNLDVYLSCHKNHYEIIESHLKVLNRPENLNQDLKGMDPFYMGSLFALNQVTNYLDSKLNLLDEETLNAERFIVEKQTNLRITLLLGILMLAFLLSAYLFEGYLTKKIEKEDEGLLEVSAKTSLIEKLRNENTFLKSNLTMLKKLKGGRVEYSSLLSDIAQVMNTGSCITGIDLLENKKGFISVELTGLAYSQQDVAELISKMEYSKKFKETSLLFSSTLNLNDSYNSSEIKDGDYVKFNIAAKYYAE